jgi:predicted RNase H-like HicB family nuclease
MKLYHVSIEQDDGWFVGHVLEREGIPTQGRTLDELVFMVRDAISLMWDETGVHLERILPGEISVPLPPKRRFQPRQYQPVPEMPTGLQVI